MLPSLRTQANLSRSSTCLRYAGGSWVTKSASVGGRGALPGALRWAAAAQPALCSSNTSCSTSNYSPVLRSFPLFPSRGFAKAATTPAATSSSPSSSSPTPHVGKEAFRDMSFAKLADLIRSTYERKWNPRQYFLVLLFQKTTTPTQFTKALTFFQEFQRKNVETSPALCADMQRAAARVGQSEKVLSIFADLLSYRTWPSIFTWNRLLRDFVERGDVQNAVLTFNALTRKPGFAPNARTYEHMVRCFCEAGDWQTAKKYWEVAKQEGFNQPPLHQPLLYSCYMRSLWKAAIHGVPPPPQQKTGEEEKQDEKKEGKKQKEIVRKPEERSKEDLLQELRQMEEQRKAEGVAPLSGIVCVQTLLALLDGDQEKAFQIASEFLGGCQANGPISAPILEDQQRDGQDWSHSSSSPSSSRPPRRADVSAKEQELVSGDAESFHAFLVGEAAAIKSEEHKQLASAVVQLYGRLEEEQLGQQLTPADKKKLDALKQKYSS
ncbi:hypothetical protein QOT17_006409 [Balamuthia mandrillaris]